MKKYLITGGTGFIGRNITKALLNLGYQVRILDNNSRGSLDSLSKQKGRFEFVKADVRDLRSVRHACKGISGVIHLASINGTKFFYSMPEVVLDVSTRGMINIIDGCLWHGVEELFVASSSEVYHTPTVVPTPENVKMVIPDPMNPRYSYAGGKIISELLSIHYGKKYFKKTIVFRPHNVYGPEMGWEHVIPQFILRMKKLSKKGGDPLGFPIQGTGKETRSFIFIDDFVDGFITLLKKGKHLEIYNIGSAQEVTIKKVAMEVARFFRQKIIIIPGKRAQGGPLRRFPDITKIKRLGYAPKVSLREGINITAKWYNANASRLPSAELP